RELRGLGERFHGLRARRERGSFLGFGPRWMARHVRRWARALDLTPEQRRQLNAHKNDYLKKVALLRGELTVRRIELREALGEPKASLKTLEEKVRALEEKRTAILLEGVRMHRAMLNLLTEAQRKKLEELAGTNLH
ncbi:MAG: Spy/CpxP family protein refolding chaperone, partial [Nitrospinota bacterium]